MVYRVNFDIFVWIGEWQGQEKDQEKTIVGKYLDNCRVFLFSTVTEPSLQSNNCETKERMNDVFSKSILGRYMFIIGEHIYYTNN